MSKLRPECKDYRGSRQALSLETALFLIRDSVLRRRELIHGKLHDGRGHHCAIGAFWKDNPSAVIPHSDLVDEVAQVNDSLGPNAAMAERWKKVSEWLRFRVRTLKK